ncbi:MAG: AAA family ATPase [Sumerlaeia bacterium]
MPGASGFLLGKFLPPHRGHQYLIDFARHIAPDLTVLVGTLEREPIPGHLRYQWLREAFPTVRFCHLAEDIPQYPHEHPDFWDIWRRAIRRFLPEGPDYVFASEDYGFRLAEELGAEYIPVDHARELVPVSGTALRERPMTHWPYLLPQARPYFVKRVCVFGPESTGKSTLARNLAAHFRTVYAAEYARPLLDFQDGQCGRDDIPRIARGQMASEDALALQANRVLFTDTDLATTTIWSHCLFQDCPSWIEDEAARRRYDMTLLLDVDVPWVPDGQRFYEDCRREFFDLCREKLERLGRPYRIIRGDWDQRLAQAVEIVEPLVRD